MHHSPGSLVRLARQGANLPTILPPHIVYTHTHTHGLTLEAALTHWLVPLASLHIARFGASRRDVGGGGRRRMQLMELPWQREVVSILVT